MPTAAQRHLAAIKSGEVTKTNIIGIRKALNHVARLEARLSGNRCSVTPAEAREIESAIAAHRPRVVGELHDSGLKLLRSPRYRKRLESVRPGIDALESFRLVGFEFIDSLHVTPIYAAWAHVPPVKGRDPFPPGATYEAFKFRNVAWQSGGNGPEIIS